MSRRSGRSWPCRQVRDVAALEDRSCPPVGSSSRVSSRPVVVLPQPDSPTRPSVSPLSTSKSMPSTACTAPTCRLSRPLVIGKCFSSPRTESSARSSPASPSGATRRRRPSSLTASSFGLTSSRQIRCRSSVRQVAAHQVPAAAGSRSSSGTTVLPSAAGARRVRAARVEGAARRHVDQRRRGALDRACSRSVVGRSRRGIEPSRPQVYGCSGRSKIVVGRAVLDAPAAVHDQDVVGELGHHAQVVGDDDERGVELAPAGRASGRGSAPARSRRARWSARRRSAAPGR